MNASLLPRLRVPEALREAAGSEPAGQRLVVLAIKRLREDERH